MCLGFPGLIEWKDEYSAGVDIGGTKREVSLMMLADEIEIGDWVMVHAGFAIAKMDAEEAQKTLQVILEMAEELGEDELGIKDE